LTCVYPFYQDRCYLLKKTLSVKVANVNKPKNPKGDGQRIRILGTNGTLSKVHKDSHNVPDMQISDSFAIFYPHQGHHLWLVPRFRACLGSTMSRNSMLNQSAVNAGSPDRHDNN
jgi:hypothetical protein